MKFRSVNGRPTLVLNRVASSSTSSCGGSPVTAGVIILIIDPPYMKSPKFGTILTLRPSTRHYRLSRLVPPGSWI